MEALKKQCRDLEAKLARAIAEKEELARDVEALCMQGSDVLTFTTSSVLQERIIYTGDVARLGDWAGGCWPRSNFEQGVAGVAGRHSRRRAGGPLLTAALC